MERIIVHSLKETGKVARRIAKSVRGGEVFALQGPLGVGKTAFVKAFAKALGVRATVTSPTFLLMRVYRVGHRASSIEHLVHVDAYRVRDAQELVDIGLGEYLGRADTVVLIEWAEKVKKLMPKPHTQWIRFAFGQKQDERIITMA